MHGWRNFMEGWRRLHICRMFLSEFTQIPLKPLENRAFAKRQPPLGERAKGYLAWHRSVLVCIAPILVVTSGISIGIAIYNYRDPEAWLEHYFGTSAWNQLSVASSSVMGIYTASLAVDVARYASQLLGSLLVVLALWCWSNLSVSASLLGVALLLGTGMPFVLELTIPVASFIDIRGVQQAICVSELQSTISSLDAVVNMSSLVSKSAVENVCTEVRPTPSYAQIDTRTAAE